MADHTEGASMRRMQVRIVSRAVLLQRCPDLCFTHQYASEVCRTCIALYHSNTTVSGADP